MSSPRWLQHTITLSAIYGILWSVVHIIWPEFSFCHVLKKNPSAMRIIDWSLLVFTAVNIVTLVALKHPINRRTWFVWGALYHTVSSIGVIYALLTGLLSDGFWMALLLNHALWIIPFVLMAAWAIGANWRMMEILNYLHGLESDIDLATVRTHNGPDLGQLSEKGPVMLVFLRHFGCTFCRYTLRSIKEQEKCLAERGTTVVLVHMVSDDEASKELNAIGLGHLHRISDPSCALYDRFGLEKGTVSELFGPKVIYRAIVLGIIQRLGIGGYKGDPAQLPGIFLLNNNHVVKAFRHQSAADMPDLNYLSVVD